MGVLACNRNGCNNIMCNRCSNNYGYLCDECFDELVDLGPHTDIDSFMGREPERNRTTEETAYEKFNRMFAHRNDAW